MQSLLDKGLGGSQTMTWFARTHARLMPKRPTGGHTLDRTWGAVVR